MLAQTCSHARHVVNFPNLCDNFKELVSEIKLCLQLQNSDYCHRPYYSISYPRQLTCSGSWPRPAVKVGPYVKSWTVPHAPVCSRAVRRRQFVGAAADFC